MFDVSHMGQLRIWGDKRTEFIESLVPGDIAGLQPNQARLSVLTNEQGGIIDDCMVTAKADHLYMVVNGACKDKDIAHLQQHLQQFNQQHGTAITIEYFSAQWELLAFQGPQAAAVLQRLVPSSVELSKLPFMFSANIDVAGVQCVVSRCGYTGEDGFEMAVPANQTKKVFHALLSEKVSSAYAVEGKGRRGNCQRVGKLPPAAVSLLSEMPQPHRTTPACRRLH